MTGSPPAGGHPLPPVSPFAGDDGSADPHLAAVLAEHAAGRADVPDVVAALAGVRLLVPVLAHLERADVPSDGGLPVDKEASTGVVAVRTGDGRIAMPVFSATATAAAWRADARPVPSLAPRAALAALAEGWQVLVLDPAGPVPVVVPRPAVVALAQGVTWEPAVRHGQVAGPVAEAVAGALAAVPEVRAVDVRPGTRAEVAVELTLRPGLDRQALDDVLARVGAALAGDATTADRVDGLELRLRADS